MAARSDCDAARRYGPRGWSCRTSWARRLGSPASRLCPQPGDCSTGLSIDAPDRPVLWHSWLAGVTWRASMSPGTTPRQFCSGCLPVSGNCTSASTALRWTRRTRCVWRYRQLQDVLSRWNLIAVAASRPGYGQYIPLEDAAARRARTTTSTSLRQSWPWSASPLSGQRTAGGETFRLTHKRGGCRPPRRRTSPGPAPEGTTPMAERWKARPKRATRVSSCTTATRAAERKSAASAVVRTRSSVASTHAGRPPVGGARGHHPCAQVRSAFAAALTAEVTGPLH